MKTSDNLSATYAIDAKDLSISFARLLPDEGGDVDAFIAAAANALDVREAALARDMGVSQATLSSWKSRGRLAESARQWFTSREFLNGIVFRQKAGRLSNGQHGIGFVLRLLKRSDFHPFGPSETDQIVDCTRYFSGMAALAQFVAARTPKTTTPEVRVSQILDTLEELLSHARDTLA